MNPFQLIKEARLILARLRIDTTCVVVRFERGTLLLTGRLEAPYSVEARKPDLNVELLHEMDRQLRRLEGVGQIDYVIKNWMHNSDGHWGKRTGPRGSRAANRE